ncbi:hypothetical protein JMJ35_002798 [Cladonia borealis]|uniref:Uncharacterized protein n=1 Tax=Cladonia borealis TaxID=184061 RepID=A0AA39UC75_9LECA|nr:hypothetical protein JMJ35_002798 [Cladonia borealis]
MPSPNSPSTQATTITSTTQSTYNTLITALHPLSPLVLELDILPSTYPSHIHLSASSLALPKTLLIPLYLHARQILFTHLSHPETGDRSNNNNHNKEVAWKATTVILLWDPNHITAANIRKRWIRDLADKENGTGLVGITENGYGRGEVRAAVQQELRFLESLLTSPLKKHTKAPTLWAQRGWVVGTFWDDVVALYKDEGEEAGILWAVKRFWDGELGVVMRAGERHPRNYYAWQYARVLFGLVQGNLIGEDVVEGLERVKGWCFLHPRDISGWGFLMFLVHVVVEQGVNEEVRRVVRETREWVRKYEWKGESVEWFLKGVESLRIER